MEAYKIYECESEGENLANAAAGLQKTADDKRKVLRFSISDDISLLKAVLAVNPYTAADEKEKWTKIHETVKNDTNKPITVKAVKDRVDILLKTDRDNWKKVMEKEILLHSVKELQEEYAKPKASAAKTSSATGTLAGDSAGPSSSNNADLITDATTSANEEQLVSILSSVEQSMQEFPFEAEGSGGVEHCQRDPGPSTSKACIPVSGKRKIVAQSHAGVSSKKRVSEHLTERERQDNIRKNKELELRARALKLEEDKLDLERKKLEFAVKHKRSERE